MATPDVSNILDLPEDILTLIFGDLQPKSFLNFCTISKKALDFRFHPYYWRQEASSTFRLPISPLLHADGQRWYWLYKKLKTQSRLFTWGRGNNHNLGPGRALRFRTRPLRRGPRVAEPPFERVSSSWPTEVYLPDEIGIIVDLQCGGWSTSILTSDGRLYTIGIIDAADGRRVGNSYDRFTRLEYLTQSTANIRHFSSGRRHTLALDDNGEVISWDRINAKGYKVFSRTGLKLQGHGARVVAGWGQSSVYLPSSGIMYWPPIKNDEADSMVDSAIVLEITIPGTARREEIELGKKIAFEVIAHVVLEGFIVFVTSQSKLMACAIGGEPKDQDTPSEEVFAVPGYALEGRVLKDLQGGFRNFTVFTESGEVLAGDTAYLQRCRSAAQENRTETGESSGQQSASEALIQLRPQDVPALQHSGVISVAFGDYHYHALHKDGSITAHGNEPESCGALGLGEANGQSFFRGVEVDRNRMRGTASLLPTAAQRGRQVWFEPEKRDWLMALREALPESVAFKKQWTFDRISTSDIRFQSIYSEWVEQEGRHWEDGAYQYVSTRGVESMSLSAGEDNEKQRADYDSLQAYFAISVAAAGWHSGAIVLVNDALAEEVRERWKNPLQERASNHMPGEFEPDDDVEGEHWVWIKKPLPRIQLSEAAEMTQGEGPLHPWRDGLPTENLPSI